MPWEGQFWRWTQEELDNLHRRMREYNALTPEARAAVDDQELGRVRVDAGPLVLSKLAREGKVTLPDRPDPWADPEVHDAYDTLCITAGRGK